VRFGESRRRRRRRRRRACDDVRACFGWRSIYAIVLREVGGVATTTTTTRTTRTTMDDADGTMRCRWVRVPFGVARARVRVVRATTRRAVARDVRMRGNVLARVVSCVRSDDDDDDARRRRTRRGELRAGNVRRESCTAESMVVRRWCVWVGDLHSVV